MPDMDCAYGCDHGSEPGELCTICDMVEIALAAPTGSTSDPEVK